MRGCPALDGQGRVFVALGSTLVALDPGLRDPVWSYPTSGMIMGSPAIGPDGVVRIHATDGFLHMVDREGGRCGNPVAVGDPLGSASPLVDGENRTWISLSGGGLISIDGEGQLARRPYYRTRRRFDCTGLVRDQQIYLGAEDHFVHAVNLSGKHGENSWKRDPNAGRTGGAITCPLTISGNDELLVVSRDGLLHAMDWDGRNMWSVPLPGQVFGSPVVDQDGTILLGISLAPRHQAPSGILLAIDGATHKVRWQFNVDAPVESTPVIGDDAIVYFGDNGGCVYALDPPGNLKWTASFDVQVRSCGTILSPRVVAFGLDDGSLVALECSSQRLATSGWPKFRKTHAQSGSLED